MCLLLRIAGMGMNIEREEISQQQRPCGCMHVHMRAQLLSSCPTLCNPMDCGLPGSTVHGILKVRILEWVAISFSRGSS